ncbi:hypothetical protein Vi05172_g13552 [Venturia inaequalis]|nr:hypothetical protein Vi05172_g13552 [Venturia inaequalis]
MPMEVHTLFMPPEIRMSEPFHEVAGHQSNIDTFQLIPDMQALLYYSHPGGFHGGTLTPEICVLVPSSSILALESVNLRTSALSRPTKRPSQVQVKAYEPGEWLLPLFRVVCCGD